MDQLVVCGICDILLVAEATETKQIVDGKQVKGCPIFYGPFADWRSAGAVMILLLFVRIYLRVLPPINFLSKSE